ncbi:hypothetical protein Bpfe_016408 [Biomphalaria pfeifferi]|uniref:Uncharacterized protein n=1 Tax=Biomphalaria pfeifferi TaxID=112525 RepID=A0AAD8F8C7_BIOPF|nr:hypothetical protein Bpfe_016408 [Biomphalaria pfeifferi]
MCISAIIIIGIDECKSIKAKSELSRGRPLQHGLEKAYLLDVRLLAEDNCGALDFVCNVAEGEPAAPLRDVCREGLLKQRTFNGFVDENSARHYLSLCQTIT